LEVVALGLPLADGESLGVLLCPLDVDRVLLGASGGITIGLWLGLLEGGALGLPLADKELLRLLLGLILTEIEFCLVPPTELHLGCG
jgi:hypothetical protein